ncbi:LysE family translocator [Bordetella genomosp. 2]|uniref:Threonine transporter RhtB n=1 Tax=Bordetella genomosp. 2 TaxID=1983456 RepID=A0A261VWF7_9BORD|nr:LysE family translocator [Bordetella genomosp. 2]OZI78444.1 threonine transporter RhtB [Bordetella genomosp. 2]
MTPTAALIAFCLAAGILTLTPGLDTALVLRTSAIEGGRRAMLAGLGICAGCLVWGVVAALGLGSLLAASQTAYDVLRICGAAYLFYLGVKLLWRAVQGHPPAAAAGPAAPPASHWSGTGAQWFLRGCLTNVLNPKVGVFYVTFLPQFIPAGVDVLGFSLLLAGLHALMGVLWFAALVAATRPLSRWLQRGSVLRGLDAVTGGVFVAFGVKLVMERR